MEIPSAVIAFLVQFVAILSRILSWAILIDILMSWVSTGRTQIGVFIHRIVTPLLRPFRWARIGMLDLSPLVALLLLDFLSGAVIQWLSQWA